MNDDDLIRRLGNREDIKPSDFNMESFESNGDDILSDV